MQVVVLHLEQRTDGLLVVRNVLLMNLARCLEFPTWKLCFYSLDVLRLFVSIRESQFTVHPSYLVSSMLTPARNILRAHFQSRK